MSSNLKVNTILPSTGTNIGIGTAGGTVTIVGDVDIADKIVHTGDTNTSIRFPSADTITAETGGTERLRIASDGVITAQKSASFGNTSDSFTAVQITSSTSGISELRFGDTTANAGYIKYEHSNNALIFATNATERARITSGGKVNIGGDFSASTYGLQVWGSGGTNSATLGIKNNVSGPAGIHLLSGHGNWSIFNSWSVGDALEFRDEGANSTRMMIDSSGRVMIGTTTETNNIRLGNKLAIVGTTPYIGMSITNYPGTNGNYAPMLDFNRSRGTSDQSMTSVAVNDKLGEIIFRGSDGSNFEDGAAIRAFVDATPANDTTDMPGRLTFCTSGDGDTTLHERCRITSAGELGVNTTVPVEKLGISGNMRFVNPTGTTSRITALPSGSYNTGTSGGSAICFQRFADGGGGSDEIFFETHWQGNRHGESMRINKHGHVINPNQPSFNVTIGGGQLNSNVGVIVFTDTTTLGNHNTGNHYNTSNGRFTAPVAGRYQINARMLTNSSTTLYTIYMLRVNANHHGYIGHNHSDYWLMESGSWVLDLAANDYVDCYLQQHSGHGGFNYASFSGFLIG
jgi:hypothetical protein